MTPRFTDGDVGRDPADLRSDSRLPFDRELAAGSLSRERFAFYLLQDAHYLGAFARALAVAAAGRRRHDALIKLPEARARRSWSSAPCTRAFSRTMASRREAAATEPSPTCAHYTHYLLALAYSTRQGRGRGAAAVLLDLLGGGQTSARRPPPENPYQAWIDT